MKSNTELKAKIYLRRIRWLDNSVNAKLEQISVLRSQATQVCGMLKQDRVQETKHKDKIEKLIVKIVELESQIIQEIDALVDLKRDVASCISQLANEDHKVVLTLRYLNLKTWEQIAVEMNYDYSWVHRLHARALIEMSDVLKEATKNHI